jgi:hypothetical protein
MRRRRPAGWAAAARRLAHALDGTAPMVVPDLTRFHPPRREINGSEPVI